MISVSIIIVNFRTPEVTIACVRSIMDGQPADVEIIIVDNMSGDDSVELMTEALPKHQIIASTTNGGFAAGCAQGVGVAKGEYLCFINSDCLVDSGAIDTMRSYLDEHTEVSLVAPRLLETDGHIQHNVAKLPTLKSVVSEYLLGRLSGWYGDLERWDKPTQIESCSGAALMIRSDDYVAAGGFNQRYFMYVEDVELCFQLGKLGKRLVYLPDARMTHHGGVSSRDNVAKLNSMMHQNRIDYMNRHFPTVSAALARYAVSAGLVIMRTKYVIKNFYHSSSASKK